ncbi:MAG: hypothetical protein AAGG53_16030 [Cyanobacteria bacterium P01_H01_bin.152]
MESPLSPQTSEPMEVTVTVKVPNRTLLSVIGFIAIAVFLVL